MPRAEPGVHHATRTYRSERRAQRSLATRRRVLEVATTSFIERGYAATTIKAVAVGAEVAVPTVELAFGTKANLLKAAIDVAIAGDDEPVPVLQRAWAVRAARARSGHELAAIAAAVLTEAQHRSSGLVLAAFEGAPTDPSLAELADRLAAQRRESAAWLVDQLAAIAGRRGGQPRTDAIDTVWLLMEPATFERCTRRLGWTAQRYERFIADAIVRLITDDPAARPANPTPRGTPR